MIVKNILCKVQCDQKGWKKEPNSCIVKVTKPGTHKKGVPHMYDFSTELMKTLVEKQSLEEFFRKHLETAINSLLESELSAFLGYEKYAVAGWNSGNSRNGSYQSVFDTRYGALNITIPRDRNGEFQQQLLPKHQR